MSEQASDWHVYLVRTGDGHLYTGIATDVDRRFKEHGGAGNRGSKYLRGRGPLELVYRSEVGERGLALRVEHQLKRMSKREKEEVVARSPSRGALLRQLFSDLAES